MDIANSDYYLSLFFFFLGVLQGCCGLFPDSIAFGDCGIVVWLHDTNQYVTKDAFNKQTWQSGYDPSLSLFFSTFLQVQEGSLCLPQHRRVPWTPEPKYLGP